MSGWSHISRSLKRVGLSPATNEAPNSPLFWTSFVRHETLARVVRHLEDETHPGCYTRTVSPDARNLAKERPERYPLWSSPHTHVEADGRIVGYSTIACDARNRLWIDDIKIDHRFQGRGYGRAAVGTDGSNSPRCAAKLAAVPAGESPVSGGAQMPL